MKDNEEKEVLYRIALTRDESLHIMSGRDPLQQRFSNLQIPYLLVIGLALVTLNNYFKLPAVWIGVIVLLVVIAPAVFLFMKIRDRNVKIEQTLDKAVKDGVIETITIAPQVEKETV